MTTTGSADAWENLPDDADKLPDGRRRCTARRSDGSRRCRRGAIAGGTVCPHHGGAIPRVKDAARRRLPDLVPAAMRVMGDVLEDPDAKDADRLRAASEVLDRTGHSRGQSLTDAEARRQLVDVIKAKLREHVERNGPRCCQSCGAPYPEDLAVLAESTDPGPAA